jgi:hypothetical protein
MPSLLAAIVDVCEQMIESRAAKDKTWNLEDLGTGGGGGSTRGLGRQMLSPAPEVALASV